MDIFIKNCEVFSMTAFLENEEKKQIKAQAEKIRSHQGIRMSMKEIMEKLGEESYRAQRKASDAFPDEKKREFLLSRGWTDHHGPSVGRMTFMSPPNDDGHGFNLDMAYWDEVRKARNEQRKEEVATRIAECRCNKCGVDMMKWDKDIGEKPFALGYYGLVDATVSGGYSSDALSDCTIYTFSLCEKCLMELFEQFKEPPKIEAYA